MSGRGVLLATIEAYKYLSNTTTFSVVTERLTVGTNPSPRRTSTSSRRSTRATIDLKEDEPENSKIEAVRLVVPLTDDPTLVCITFRFWVLSLFFSIIGSVINEYYYFRVNYGTFSIYFVNLASYAVGTGMARILPINKLTIGGYSMSFNPGPFNIKEHTVIGIAVSTASTVAYATDILAVTNLFLSHQCLGYGMAGVLRKYLVYPAEMVWWSNLVQVVFYNAIHNTDEFKTKKMIRGWSYMKYFWVFCGGMFLWEFVPQFLAPMFVFFDWICWISPFNMDIGSLFNSYTGPGILSLSFDWTSIGGATMWLPLSAQLCNYGGVILSYWIILPILWITNTLGTKSFGEPLTAALYYTNGTYFDIEPYLNDDFSLNEALYEVGPPVTMTPMYALGFFFSFVALAGCVSHIVCFSGAEIMKSWKAAVGSDNEDIHTKLMRIYPEVPQLWHAAFYTVMLGLSMMVCEVYGPQHPWWGILIACALAWLLTLPICAMAAITGFNPGLNVITELVCGYMLPGKPIANMAFKCYGYMAMFQCMTLLSDLKLGHYMKIPPRAMFVSQFWGAVVGGIFNYITMLVIVDAHRDVLVSPDGDPAGVWAGNNPKIFWGPLKSMVPWAHNGCSALWAGSITVALIWQFWLFRYHKNWWSKYTFMLSAALDTGAAFTGLFIFIFFEGGLSSKMVVKAPSWWANYVLPDGSNGAYANINRCGAAHHNWTSGTLDH
ncbi:MAG: OPT oligopeptide transporter protein-domain-containing protein [Linnemannia elongata]|nr:MAG: OPT oligopeptide transporter protein-domain-containing protein [Linnemannia elongata]